MSRYWVFTEEQLEEALRQWLHLDGDMHSCTTGGKAIRDFLNSSFCVSAGMARDLPAPAAPEIHVAEEPAS